ncbi:DNA polymerase III subunit gamma/tau [Filimonas lacunae]|nr:DNA polymerase III subunit gamma/tau [Filimonas lacunae]BAV10148.1 DNA polymerase III subunits gamma and tau [Filimonas lacunae]
MDKFIVSARKYRPQEFDTVVGQAHITTTLKNAIKNSQLAHAFLFCGPRGVGKTTCARILAKTINCESLKPDGEACNQCNSCRTFNEGTSLNIHELDAASNNSVDDIRSLVEQVRFAPQAGKYKVYIVDEVHMLSASAFNAFLKTLEEPPSYAIFILATTEKHKILPTILSRCQIFDFKRITGNDTVDHLQSIADKEEIKAEKGALQVIAQKSEGCMRDALSILDKIVSFTNGEVTYHNTLEHLNILDHDYFFRLLDYLMQQDLAGAMLLYDEINRKGFEGDLVLNGFAEFIRNLLVCKDPRAAVLLDVVEGMQNKYTSTAAKANGAYLVSALNILNEAEIHFKMARNKRLHVELTLIKLNFLQQALELSVENGVVAKKKRIDGPLALKVRMIPSLQQKTAAATVGAKLYIDNQGGVARPPQPNGGASGGSMHNGNGGFTNGGTSTAGNPGMNNVVVNTGAAVAEPQGRAPVVPMNRTALPAKGKKSLLDTLRDKYGDQYQIEEVKEALPLSMERLREVWDAYAQKLEGMQKPSAANTFRLSKINIESEVRFSVTVNSLIQQTFIEQERIILLDTIQQHFYNRSIAYYVILNEEEEAEEVPVNLGLNSRQKFDKLSDTYPWLRELKDRLKLELDY